MEMEKEAVNQVKAPNPKLEVKKKRLDRVRKKDEKNFEQFLKSISGLSPEEKVDVLCKKNSELSEELHTLQGSLKLLERRIVILEKEKEQLQNDQSKSVVARARLENLCRELQRQNKAIKEESLAKIREEEEKRKEVSTKFQTTLNDVTLMMQQNSDKNLKLRDDNIEISTKFQKLCEQFKQREDEVCKMTKQMDLEKQLADATISRFQCQLAAEKEIWNKEKEELFKQLRKSAEEKLKLEVDMKNLEEHLAMYSNRYEEFETTIVKSNKVFDTYKVEMAKMSKQVSKLEKECNTWKERWLHTSKSVNHLLCENHSLETESKETEKKVVQLTGLCRMLQEERALFLKQLKENNIEPEKLPPPEIKPTVDKKKTPPPPTKGYAITKKERELKKLRHDISELQNKIQTAVQQKTEENNTSSRSDVNKGKHGNKDRKVNRVTDKANKKTKVFESVNEQNESVITDLSDTVVPTLECSVESKTCDIREISPLHCNANIDNTIEAYFQENITQNYTANVEQAVTINDVAENVEIIKENEMADSIARILEESLKNDYNSIDEAEVSTKNECMDNDDTAQKSTTIVNLENIDTAQEDAQTCNIDPVSIVQENMNNNCINTNISIMEENVDTLVDSATNNPGLLTDNSGDCLANSTNDLDVTEETQLVAKLVDMQLKDQDVIVPTNVVADQSELLPSVSKPESEEKSPSSDLCVNNDVEIMSNEEQDQFTSDTNQSADTNKVKNQKSKKIGSGRKSRK